MTLMGRITAQLHEPLIGDIVREQAMAAVDMLGRRRIRVNRADFR